MCIRDRYICVGNQLDIPTGLAEANLHWSGPQPTTDDLTGLQNMPVSVVVSSDSSMNGVATFWISFRSVSQSIGPAVTRSAGPVQLPLF